MKKVPIVYVIGLLLPVLAAVQAALGDTAADLKQAEALYKAHQYAEAEQAYLKVIREADPNKSAESQAAFTAGKGLPLVYIATDRLPQARDAVQQLLSNMLSTSFCLMPSMRSLKEPSRSSSLPRCARSIRTWSQPGPATRRRSGSRWAWPS